MPSVVWEVTELDPGQSFTWRSKSPGVMTVGTHLVRETASNGTAVTLGIHQSGSLTWLIGLLVGSRVRRYVQMEADGLKRHSEARL
jgi:hypothetical protein